jgi:hypothetical protein
MIVDLGAKQWGDFRETPSQPDEAKRDGGKSILMPTEIR